MGGTCKAQTIKTSASEDSISYGFLSITTQLDSVYVVINDNFRNVYHLANRDTISLKTGKQRIRIIKKYYDDLITTVTIKPDTVSEINTNLLPFRGFRYYKYYSSYPRIFWGAPVIIKGEQDARLFVNGKFAGQGLARVDTTGYLTVRSELPDGQIKTKSFYVDDGLQTFHVITFYQRPQKNKAYYLSILPGASQIYQNNKLKGYVLLGASIIGSGLAIKFNQDFTNQYQKFEDTQRKYLTATDPQSAFELGNLADKQLRNAKLDANLRNAFMYGTIGIYIYNVVDGLLRPKMGYRKKLKIDPYVDFDPRYKKQIGVIAHYNF